MEISFNNTNEFMEEPVHGTLISMVSPTLIIEKSSYGFKYDMSYDLRCTLLDMKRNRKRGDSNAKA